MRSVSLIRCLPKISPSSSTSTGSQIITWRRSLTWTRHEFSYDLRPPSTGKMFVWLPAFLSEPGSARYSSTPHRHSQLSDLTIRLHITTSLKSISQNRWLYHQMFKWSFWPVQFSVCQSRDQSFFVLIGQSPSVGTHKYVNIHKHQLFSFSELNNGWSMTATVLQRKASTQLLGLLLVPAIKGAVYINIHYI